MKQLTNNGLNLARGLLPYSKSECHEAYLALYSVRHLFRKPAALAAAGTQIFQRYAESWPVIGITERALTLIAESGLALNQSKLQRAHLKNRADTWVQLMQFEHSEDEFWEVFHEADKTVLCLKEENANINRIDFIPVDSGLFIPQGYRARIGAAERKWVNEIISKRKIES